MQRKRPTRCADTVSAEPLILLFPEFVSREEVATLLRMSKTVESLQASCRLECPEDDRKHWPSNEQDLVASIERRIGEITNCSPHDDEPPLLILHARPPEKVPGLRRSSRPRVVDRFPSGFHVDVNGDKPRRFASAILYLTTPESGGQTVFPLAKAPSSPADEEEPRKAALDASPTLLRAGVYHTGNSKRAEARALESVAPGLPTTSSAPASASHVADAHGGVACRAQAGSLLVFYTRGPSGELDERSWHAGEALGADAVEDKWILRKFKEIPPAEFEDVERRRQFVARSQRPHLDAYHTRVLL